MPQAAAPRNRSGRLEAAERSRDDILRDVDEKLQDAARALTLAQTRIEAVEQQAAAAESRAQIAEALAQEARRVLAQVEDAIRSRLLGEGIEFDSHETLHAVA